MPRPKWTLNTIYISERLQERLRPISRCALTTVVAPMGYGKTTAVNWYLAGRAKAEDAVIVRISVYSDHLAIFWKSVQDAFDHAGLPLLRGYACPDDAAGASLLADDLCHGLAGRGSVYIFIDDFHLLTDGRITEFLCTLVNRLPENVHLIVASRDRFLPGDAVMRLGSRVYPIGAEHLRLNHTELSIYAHRCGTDLTDTQVETLLHASEGWFSAVYLNLRTLSEHGALPDRHSDIYTMFSAAMIEPLSPRQQEFLAVMGLADEFTAPMARFVTGDPDTDRLLTMLTEQNAFVTRLPDGVSYRFHHMMKVCAEQAFAALPGQTRRAYHGRYGAWYSAHGQYLHALAAYRKGEDYDAVLRVIQDDAGILLAALSPEEVLAFLDACPRDTLQAHPLTLLVLMRRMFTWQQIPKMLELRALLLAGIEAHPELPDAERDNLLGECDLIMSFLQYNDIAAMSRLHRSAAARMTRPAISIRNEGSWTFGSPSVLMMFHRTPGQLDAELDAMNACMPHYYRLTNGHGQGAERIMDAEAALLRGRFADAAIFLERARAAIAGNGQENMALCCDFLERRLALCVDTAPPEPPAHKRAALLAQHDTMWLRIFDSACAYCAALTGQTGQVPALFREHALHTVHFLAPCRPMMEMIENQVYLAEGAYARVIGRSEGLLAQCTQQHYALVALQVRIQTAAAYAALGKRPEARSLLGQALREAEPDGLLLPFAENGRGLRPLLAGGAWEADLGDFPQRAADCIAAYEARCAALCAPGGGPPALAGLTEREREIAALIAARLTNGEIARRLFLSDGSVKQYVHQIYAKLGLTGDAKSKRQQLIDQWHAKP